MEAKSQNKLQVNAQISYREKRRSNEKDFLIREYGGEVKIHKCGIKSIKREKGRSRL